MTEVTIPVAVWDAAQTELHDLRALFAKLAGRQELVERHSGRPDLLDYADLWVMVRRLIAEYRAKDYRSGQG